MRISASKIKTFMACGMKAKFHYEDKIKVEKDSNNLTYGSALHESLELLIEGVDIHDASPVGEAMLREKLVFKDGDKWNEQEFLLMLGAHLTQFQGWVSSTVLKPKTLRVEESIEVGLGKHSLYGFLDWVFEMEDETIVVIDHKTTTSIYTESFVKRDVQMTIYQILAEQMYPDRDVKIGYTQFVKRKPSGKKGPEMIPPVLFCRNEAEKNEALQLAQYVATNMENKIFHVPATYEFNSPCKMCDFDEHCLKQKNIKMWSSKIKSTNTALAF